MKTISEYTDEELFSMIDDWLLNDDVREFFDDTWFRFVKTFYIRRGYITDVQRNGIEHIVDRWYILERLNIID